MTKQGYLSPSPACGIPKGRGFIRGVGEREKLLEHAKALRSNQTDAEERLWYHLRAERFMGLKFKRQKPIGPFIVDFVCLEKHLIIEADGGQHGGAEDVRRDALLKSLGFTVLRFWNNEILGQTDGVLERIRELVISLSPGPSDEATTLRYPASGRGEGNPDTEGQP